MRKLLLILFLCNYGSLSAQVFLSVDSFNYFDNAKWQKNTNGFDGIGCNFTNQNVTISDSSLKIIIDQNSDTTKNKQFLYNSGCVQGIPFYKYGYFCSRMKSDIINGTVSSFFLMNQWVPVDWIHKEIDIEFLGKNLQAVQLTNHLIDTKTNNYQSSTATISLPFSIAQDYHDFCILWTPDSVAWFADDQLLHVEKKFIPDEPMQIFMNHWNADTASVGMTDWLGGKINNIELPSVVSYDNVTIQTLNQYFGISNGINAMKSSELKIYPNPVKQNFTISLNSTYKINRIDILNIINQTVYTKQITEEVEQIDISTLQPGAYFLKVQTAKGDIFKKIIKQ